MHGTQKRAVPHLNRAGHRRHFPGGGLPVPWRGKEAAWEAGFVSLGKYFAREGHAIVPSSHTENDFNLGQWVRLQRRAKERFSTERLSRLESLPGWTWNPRETP